MKIEESAQKTVWHLDNTQCNATLSTSILIHFQYSNALTLQDMIISCKLNFNIIGGQDWEQLQNDCKTGLTAMVPVIGTCDLSLQTEFLVMPVATPSDTTLLTIGPFIKSCDNTEDTQVFPKMPGVEVILKVDPSVPPERNAYYNVPAAFREEAKLRLRDMEEWGIIEKVTSAPEWISGMTAVPKGMNDFRLVVDMQGLNKAIKSEYVRPPSIHEMEAKLRGARFFTKLNLASTYHHLELAMESRDLTTFPSEDGFYRFTRLLYGLDCAPEIFQREIKRVLDGIENVMISTDEVVIFASFIEELHNTVAKVLGIMRANNLSIKLSKCEFDKERIQFCEHQLDEKGFHVDETKNRYTQEFREMERLEANSVGFSTDDEVKQAISEDGICETDGQSAKPTPMEIIFAPKRIWELLEIDFSGPYSRFGGIHILVVSEYISRYIYVYPVNSTSFEQTRVVLERIFDREGFPKRIKINNGPPFDGQKFSRYCADRGIMTILSTSSVAQQN